MSKPYAEVLCQSLMPEPHAKALCQSLIPKSYVKALCQSLVPKPYVKVLCQGLDIDKMSSVAATILELLPHISGLIPCHGPALLQHSPWALTYKQPSKTETQTTV